MGHTHINVDAPFGISKNWLKKHPLATLEELLTVLPKILQATKHIHQWTYAEVPTVSTRNIHRLMCV